MANSWFHQAFYQETPDAFWRLGEMAGATSAVDQSVNGFDATVVGGVTFGVSGWSGDLNTAAVFNGTTGYANAGAVSGLVYTGRFSVVAAFKTSGNGAVMMIVSKALSSGPKGWALAVDAAGKPRFYAYTSSGVAVFDITSSTAYQDNNWHLAVAVYDPIIANLASLYVDGTLKASTTPSGTPDSNSARVLIGALDNAGVATSLFNGSLDEVAIYPYALTSTQVTALVNARNKTTTDKSLLQCRSGVARAGAARSNYYNPRLIVLLNGVDVAAKVWKNTLQATDILGDQADTASLTLFDKTGTLNPSCGNTLVLADGANNNRFFGGTIVRVRRRSVKNPGGGAAVAVTLFDVDATDLTWLLNRRVVTKTYPTGSFPDAIIQNLVATYAPSFTAINVRSNAPAITAPLVFHGAKLANAISSVCQSTSPNLQWYPDVNGDVHAFYTELSQRPKSLVPGLGTYDQLDYALDLTQVRTRMLVEGGGASLTAPVGAGATSIPVDECGRYSASGGTVVAPEGILITYTGLSASSGPGSLTGVPASGAGAITVPLQQGDTLNVWVVVDDAAAQVALGALELGLDGSPTDGIHEQYLAVSDGTSAQCQQAGLAELAANNTANVTGTLWSRDKLMRSGKILSIALPGRGINVDVTIQRVKRSLLTRDAWQFDVTFATVWRNFVDVIDRAARAA